MKRGAWAFAAVAMAALCELNASAGAQDLVIRQIQCRGNEPFWALDANAGAALLSRPGHDGVQETLLAGKLEPFDSLTPPWRVWSGSAVDDPGFTVVATLRAELCRDTMSDDTPPFDHRAIVAVTGEAAAVGCCRATFALDTDAAPLAEPESKTEGDWSRLIVTLLPAIRTCVIDGGVPVDSVLEAWEVDRALTAVRVQAIDGGRFDCRAPPDGGPIESVSPAQDLRPGEGKPRFLPARESAPVLAEGRLERVVDPRGALQGWLHYAGAQHDLPTGLFDIEWRLEDIEGRGVIDSLNSPLTIADDGRVSGHAGCNQMSGTATVSGASIRFGPLATTRRMCAPSIMDQEQKFLAALGRVESWRTENGLLYLMDDGGRELLRFASAY